MFYIYFFFPSFILNSLHLEPLRTEIAAQLQTIQKMRFTFFLFQIQLYNASSPAHLQKTAGANSSLRMRDGKYLRSATKAESVAQFQSQKISRKVLKVCSEIRTKNQQQSVLQPDARMHLHANLPKIFLEQKIM
jgi:hypothetical protein